MGENISEGASVAPAGMLRAWDGRLMAFPHDVSWVDGIRAFRRAGFVRAAESPSSVMLVSAGRSVLLQRVPVFDETVLREAVRSAGLNGPLFMELLSRGMSP
jgi:hypothetical protein